MPEHSRPARTSLTLLLSALLLAPLSGVIAAPPTAAPWIGKSLEGVKCSGLGPDGGEVLDYLRRNTFAGKLAMVEQNHFDEGVESLTRGLNEEPMGDIDFVLRIFPNHHRALQSAVNYSLKHKTWPPNSKGQPAECYLERAANFSPRDAFVARLYGYYLHRKGRLEMALKMNQRAMQLLPRDVNLAYNTALLLTDLKRYRQAAEIAGPLYEAGLPLPALRERLELAGVWKKDPTLDAQAQEKIRAALAAQAAADPNSPAATAVHMDDAALEEFRAALRAKAAAPDPNDPARKPVALSDDALEQIRAAMRAAAADKADGKAATAGSATTGGEGVAPAQVGKQP